MDEADVLAQEFARVVTRRVDDENAPHGFVLAVVLEGSDYAPFVLE